MKLRAAIDVADDITNDVTHDVARFLRSNCYHFTSFEADLKAFVVSGGFVVDEGPD